MEKDSKENQKNQLKNYLKYSGLGFQMIATMILAAWGGMKLDAYFGSKNHLFTIFLLLFSVIASIYLAVKGLMK